MDASQYNEISIQIEIVANNNQQLGVCLLSNNISETKDSARKLNAMTAEARNQTMILKNMIRDYSK
jgi:hypothetical protein